MKPTKTKTDAKNKPANATRGKSEPQPTAADFSAKGFYVFDHIPLKILNTLNPSDHPCITPAGLAALVGALGLPRNREGAIEALRMTWEAAAVIAEQQADLVACDRARAEAKDKAAALERFIGFKIKHKKGPITFRRFLALLSKESRKGGTVRGKKLQGGALVCEWLKQDLIARHSRWSSFKIMHPSGVDEQLAALQRDGFPEPEMIKILARDFIIWRRNLARQNMARTSRNVKPGDREEK